MAITHKWRKPVEAVQALRSREKLPVLGAFVVSGVAVALAFMLLGCGGGASTPISPPPSVVQPLQVSDVQSIVQAAVNSVNVDMVVAVVDRAGFVAGVFRTQNAPTLALGNFGQTQDANDLAVALARTGAFFSNDQAPLSSRTVRFISGIHFPPGVMNQPPADLYGIENTNRGCTLVNDAIFESRIPPSLALSGGFGTGVITGKADMNDSNATAVNPGGVPIFYKNVVLGGIGVVTSASDANGSFLMAPANSQGQPPEGDLLTPAAGPLGGLTSTEVKQVLDNAEATANTTRAAIRLPLGSRTKMVIAVADLDGSVIGLRRMPDSTVFSIDVAVTKARNMVYFNGASRTAADLNGVPMGTAVTNRTIGFGSQPLYPPGIDGSSPGPFFNLYIMDLANPCTQGFQAGAANSNKSGIVFFPGSAGLYRNGALVGGLGVSGDGVDQDDYVTSGGTLGFEAPTSIRADQLTDQGVRLPYFKFPRNPTN